MESIALVRKDGTSQRTQMSAKSTDEARRILDSWDAQTDESPAKKGGQRSSRKTARKRN